MKSTAPENQKKANMGKPKPVRFSGGDEHLLAELHDQTGLDQTELIRRAVRFACPKFLTGEVNILDVRAVELAMPGGPPEVPAK